MKSSHPRVVLPGDLVEFHSKLKGEREVHDSCLVKISASTQLPHPFIQGLKAKGGLKSH